jgi:ATP-dependent exoDNAse (exonuclease V) beta subunit
MLPVWPLWAPLPRAGVGTMSLREIVEAGAGCGKTSGLVARYVHAVSKQKFRARDILALTFTEEAASEMKKRVEADFVGTPFYQEVLTDSQISTIHSLCFRIIRAQLTALGYSSDPNVVPQFWADRIRKDFAKQHLTKHPRGPRLIEALPTQDLLSLVADRWFSDLSPSQAKSSLSQRLEDYRAELKNRLNGVELSKSATLTALAEFAHAKPEALPWESLLSLSFRGGPKIDSALLRDAKVLRAFCKKGWHRSLAPEITEQELNLSQALSEFILDCRRVGPKVLDFSAMEFECLEWLRTRPSPDRELKLLLVDEFQDTSPRQFEILQRLSHPNTEWYFVGDPKQSIYAFRGADISLFEQCRNSLILRQQSTNYRSTPEVLKTINALTERLFSDPLGPPSQVLSAGLPPRPGADSQWIQSRHPIQDALIDLPKILSEAQGRTAVLFRSWSALYKAADQLRRQKIDFEISGTEKPLDEHPLTELFCQFVDGYDQRSVALPDWIVARWSLPPDSTFDQIRAQAERLSKERVLALSQVGSPTWVELLLEFVSKVPIHSFTDSRAWASAMERVVQQFQNQFRIEATSNTQLAAWIQQAAAQAEHRVPAGPRAPQLVLMTIHASKGLQFDTVVLPQMFEYHTGHSSKSLGLEGDDSTQFELKDRLGRKLKSLHFEIERRLSLLKKDLEMRRVFYVALTRAERRLYVYSKVPKTREADPHGLEIFGLPSRSASAWTDFLNGTQTDFAQVQVRDSAEQDQEPTTQWMMAANSAAKERATFIRGGVSSYLSSLESGPSPYPARASRPGLGRSSKLSGEQLHRALELWDGSSNPLQLLRQIEAPDLLSVALEKLRALPELEIYWSTLRNMPLSVHREFDLYVRSASYRLSGVADLVIEVPDGLWIIDWKSSSSLESLTRRDRTAKIRAQLRLYASAFQRRSPIHLMAIGIELSQKIEVETLFQEIYETNSAP